MYDLVYYELPAIIPFLFFKDAHNSMSDVKATLKCFKEMKKLGWI